MSPYSRLLFCLVLNHSFTKGLPPSYLFVCLPDGKGAKLLLSIGSKYNHPSSTNIADYLFILTVNVSVNGSFSGSGCLQVSEEYHQADPMCICGNLCVGQY